MSDLIEAIKSNDLVKFKRIFNESMKTAVGTLLEEEKQKIAGAVVVEGEIVEAEDEVDDEEGEEKSDKKDNSDDDSDDEEDE